MALLFFDIDGTLITLDRRHMMPESAKEALKLARANGHKIFINSGRTKAEIYPSMLEFGFDGIVCGCGTYIELDGQQIFHKSLEKSDCLEYAEFLHDKEFFTVFEGKDHIFFECKGAYVDEINRLFGRSEENPILPYTDEKLQYDKFTIFKRNPAEMDAFNEKFKDIFHFIPHEDELLEMVPEGYTKATGIKFVQDYLNVPLEECYCFGDSFNDLEMLEYVTHSVAMAGATDEIKSKVEFVTTDVEDNGIMNALKHYGLI